MSCGTARAAKARKTEPIIQALTQMVRMALWRDDWSANHPARNGARAAPPSSTKDCTEIAVLRTSGSVMSCTVDTTLGEANGTKIAVTKRRARNNPGWALVTLIVAVKNTAPSSTPTVET